MSIADPARARLATRISFLAAGFGKACWAPLVPFAKDRLGLDDGTLGLMLLSLGFGSILTMPLTGLACAKTGCRPIIVGAAVSIALLLPVLAVAWTTASLTVALFGFGAALGAIDVAMNVHAVTVEKISAQPLMSNFHAHFSIGAFVGAALVTTMLSLGSAPMPSALTAASLILAGIVVAFPGFLDAGTSDDGASEITMPRGVVAILAGLTAACFLLEGAVLDWGGLLLLALEVVPVTQAGFGYMIFSVAMTAGRLTGDRLAARFGDRRLLRWGGSLSVAGLVVLLGLPSPAAAAAGFLMIGLGAANVVPTLFRMAAAQTAMPPGLAISAVTTIGYAGVLAGPAVIGFVAHGIGLVGAFWLLAGLIGFVPLLAGRVTGGSPSRKGAYT